MRNQVLGLEGFVLELQFPGRYTTPTNSQIHSLILLLFPDSDYIICRRCIGRRWKLLKDSRKIVLIVKYLSQRYQQAKAISTRKLDGGLLIALLLKKTGPVSFHIIYPWMYFETVGPISM